MGRYITLGIFALVLGVAVGTATSVVGYLTSGEHFVPNNIENPSETLASIAAKAKKAATGPRIEVLNGEHHDFGVISLGGKGSHAFKVKNVGNAPLELKVVETTCKCTVGRIDQSVVAPGETVDITLSWEAQTAIPVFSQSAQIKTNDPERQLVRLEIEGIVEDPIRAMPAELRFANVPGTEETVRTFRIYGSPVAQDFKIESVELPTTPQSEYFSYTVRQLTREEYSFEPHASSGFEVAVTLKPGLPTGEIKQDVHVHLNVDDMPLITVPISGNVISDVSVVGRGSSYDARTNTLTLGRVRRADGAKAELMVLLKGAKRDEIQLKVEEVDPDESLRATLGEPKKGDKLVTIPLTVEVPANAPRVLRLGSGEGAPATIRLSTTNAVTVGLTINVKFAVDE